MTEEFEGLPLTNISHKWEAEEDCCCDFDHEADEWCPQCCPYEGVFAGGTEDCEFCQHADFCQESLPTEEGRVHVKEE